MLVHFEGRADLCATGGVFGWLVALKAFSGKTFVKEMLSFDEEELPFYVLSKAGSRCVGKVRNLILHA